MKLDKKSKTTGMQVNAKNKHQKLLVQLKTFVKQPVDQVTHR